jgi:hypothetical protein
MSSPVKTSGLKAVIGCDFDPVLPPVLDRRPTADPWELPFAMFERLLQRMGDELPPVSWMLRADETIRYATGEYDSAYDRAAATWERLIGQGHEIGWHMHLLSFDRSLGRFRFDDRPDWLEPAYAALAQRCSPTATRTGWDYANAFLFRRLDELGVRIDCSALPGNVNWYDVGDDRIVVDWRRALETAYHPDREDYQRSGPNPLRLLELPVSQFRNSMAGMVQRIAWRGLHRCLSVRGLRNKTRLLTTDWGSDLPNREDNVWVFYFHPEDLAGDALETFVGNIRKLREVAGVEFVTASEAISRS